MTQYDNIESSNSSYQVTACLVYEHRTSLDVLCSLDDWILIQKKIYLQLEKSVQMALDFVNFLY